MGCLKEMQFKYEATHKVVRVQEKMYYANNNNKLASVTILNQRN